MGASRENDLLSCARAAPRPTRRRLESGEADAQNVSSIIVSKGSTTQTRPEHLSTTLTSASVQDSARLGGK